MDSLIHEIRAAIEESDENERVAPWLLRVQRLVAEEAIGWLECGDLAAALVAIEHVECLENKWGETTAYSRAAAKVRSSTWVGK